MPEGRGEIARRGVHDITWGLCEGRRERERKRKRDIAARCKGWLGASQRVKRATFLDFRINRHGVECASFDYNGVYFETFPTLLEIRVQ